MDLRDLAQAEASGSEGMTMPAPSEPTGNTMAIGAAVMTKYVVALEIGGILLLVSMIGAIALTRKKVTSEGWVAAEPRKPLGQVGREVEPF